MSPVEAIAVAFGLLSVWLTVRRNVWCWPTGLVQVVLFIHVFYQASLYSDALLHVVYVVLQFYGWHQWLYGGRDRRPPPVTRLSPAEGLAWLGVGAIGTYALGDVMARFTDASLPFWDAAIAALSL